MNGTNEHEVHYLSIEQIGKYEQELTSLREQLAKEQQDSIQAIDVLTTQIAKLIEQLVLERALRKELVEGLKRLTNEITPDIESYREVNAWNNAKELLQQSKLLDDKEVK